jgi:hypothetical protein
MNTGLDEIIESTLTTFAPTNPNPQVSRFLIQFSDTEIDDIIENKAKISSSAQLLNTSSWQANLRCFIATETGLNLNTTLNCFPVYGNWGMGTGKYLDEPEVTNGTSWNWLDYSGSTRWITSSFPAYITGSYNTSYASVGGGTWWTGSSVAWFNTNTYPISQSQVFSYASDKDINMDITNIVRAWYTGSISWDGLIIKQQLEWVPNENIQPELKFFSIDTHTIYPPCLEFKWRDYIFNTGSSTILNVLPATVTIEQNPGIFYPSSINKFRVYARPEYPPRVWQTASLYTTDYYLPTASYYAIKDLDTNEYVIDFDNNFTQLSADTTSSYFDIYMNGLQPERYYQILIKTTIAGTTIIYNNNYYFKIING